MPPISSLSPIMVCGVGGRLVWLVIHIRDYGLVQNTLLAHASSMPPFLSLPLTMACDDGDRCDDDNLQQLCFVTHGLWTPVSWLGSRSSIAVAAMVIIPRGPTLLAGVQSLASKNLITPTTNITLQETLATKSQCTNDTVVENVLRLPEVCTVLHVFCLKTFTFDNSECRPVFGTKGLFHPPDLPEAVHKSPQFGRAVRVRTSTQSDSTQPQLSNLVFKECYVPRNAKTGITKGCGYVTMSSLDEAKAEIAALDGSGAKLGGSGGTSSAMWTAFPGLVKHSVQPDLGCQRL
ncbi:28 kDa ribonucleoprotein, chloroplastic [Tanacetum coccineum]